MREGRRGFLTNVQPVRGEWLQQAECRKAGAPPVWFDVPERGDGVDPREHLRRQAKAAALCRACPVRAECLEDALRSRHAGIRGGVLIPYEGRPRNLLAAPKRDTRTARPRPSRTAPTSSTTTRKDTTA